MKLIGPVKSAKGSERARQKASLSLSAELRPSVFSDDLPRRLVTRHVLWPQKQIEWSGHGNAYLAVSPSDAFEGFGNSNLLTDFPLVSEALLPSLVLTYRCGGYPIPASRARGAGHLLRTRMNNIE